MNNKGFMMAEVIVVSAVILVTLVGLYTSYNKIFAVYNQRIDYYDINTLYELANIRDNYLYSDNIGERIKIGNKIVLYVDKNSIKNMSIDTNGLNQTFIDYLNFLSTSLDFDNLKAGNYKIQNILIIENCLDDNKNSCKYAYLEVPDIENSVTVNFDTMGGYVEKLYTEPNEEEDYTYVVPETGLYKLEAWGAQGGSAEGIYPDVWRGGYGGYSVGTVSLEKGTTLYINVGGYPDASYKGGYNGGGNAQSGSGTRGGGGASHVAVVSGELRDLSAYMGELYEDGSTYNSSKILIVAGGGGGAYFGSNVESKGGSGGGYIGVKGIPGSYGSCPGGGGTQTSRAHASGEGCSGYSWGNFGRGGNVSEGYGSAGGGGWYGGGGSAGQNSLALGYTAGGGGSGYIGSSLLTDKAMYCFDDCATSSGKHTLTYRTSNRLLEPVQKVAKKGNGAIRISHFFPGEIVVTNGLTYGTLPSLKKDGYMFKGWNTKSDGTGETITSDSIVNLSGDQTLYAIWDKIDLPLTYDYNTNVSFAKTEYTDTGYVIDWDKDFSIEIDFSVQAGSKRYMMIGNYGNSDTKAMNIEINTSNRLRFYIGTGSVDTEDKLGKVTIGENIKLTFTWDSLIKRYTITAKGNSTNISSSGGIFVNYEPIGGKSKQSLRIGTVDCRGNTSTFNPITISGLKIISKENKTVLNSLPVYSKTGDTFNGWNTKSDGSGTTIMNSNINSLEENQTLYAIVS